MSSCSLCGYGKYSVDTSASSESTCINCPVGRFTANEGSSGYSDCSSCPAGKYSILISGLGCRDCERGRYTATAVMAEKFECELCDRNTYSGNLGATACQNCGTGTYSHLGYATCVDCTTDKTSSSGIEHLEGSLQGFFQDEEMVGWGGGGAGDSWIDGVMGPLGSNSNVYEQDASGTGSDVLNATAELWFEGLMPLTLRGFGKATGVAAGGGGASIALLLSVDAVTFEEVLVVDLDVGGVGDGVWQYIEGVFKPNANQVAKRAKVEVRSFGGVAGSTVQWTGVGLYNYPPMR